MTDDYYLNLVDWSSHGILAVALNSAVYLWNSESGDIEELMDLGDEDYVSSVSWVQEGGLLAIGKSTGVVDLWDASRGTRLRSMRGHAARVGACSWNSHILSSGSRDSKILNHDVRAANHVVATLEGHQQEVCGLKWSPSGDALASGGNDNM